MKLSDFDFSLPDELVATRPAEPRGSAKLLVATGDDIRDLNVCDFPDILGPGDLLVLNDTKVIPARLFGKRRRDTGQGVVEANIEVTLLEPRGSSVWLAMVKPFRKLRDGEIIRFAGNLLAELLGREGANALLSFNAEEDALEDAIETYGAMPLPPYIEAMRRADEKDRSDYQTIWARKKGAVAAPTASLHFDEDLMARLDDRGVAQVHVTLHVGAGTFLPVKVENIDDHKMHGEWGQISQEAADVINAHKAKGGRVIPVGTTALRLIETAGQCGMPLKPWEGKTDIFIRPGFEFKVADALITNFHLPKSTLMMLVSALMSKERIDRIYDHAIRQRYRFFTYGDSSFLEP